MNASIKVFSILSVATVIGQIMEKQKGDERLKWRGKKLKEAGYLATRLYPYGILKPHQLRQIERKNVEILNVNGCFEITETLSFLLAALVDIRAHVKPDRFKLLDPVLRRVRWSMMLFKNHDCDELHERAYERYEKWAA